MDLKQQLLQPIKTEPVKLGIMGSEYPVTRLTAKCLGEHNRAVNEAQKSNDADQLNLIAAQLILDSIVDDNGKPAAGVLKPDDLTEVHSPSVLNQAVSEILTHNFMAEKSAETAKKD